MKIALLTLLLLAVAAAVVLVTLAVRRLTAARQDPKERELASLPTGIDVTHSPNPVKAQAGGRSGRAYTYLHETTVRSTVGPLTVVEFGALVWHDGRWVFSTYTGRPFTRSDFAEWYACPGGQLVPGRSYVDPQNWSGHDAPLGGRAKWYYIAVDATGRRFKGEGVVETLAEVGPPLEAALLAKLESMPVGLEVVHTPPEVILPDQPNADPNDWKYRWYSRTQVRAVEKPLTIKHFGIIAWDGSKWVLPPDQRRYNCGVLGREQFIDWYSCPNGRVEPASPAVDDGNWAGSHRRADFKQKWFFIGADDEGREYKGEGVVTLLAQPRPDDAR